MKSCHIHLTAICMAALLMSACKMGPDFTGPDMNISPPETFSNTADIEVTDLQPQTRWWEAFNDPEIDRLVINVIENNPDIQTAAARVLEARSIFKQTRADQYPVLSLSADAGRQSYAAFNPLTGRRAASTSNSYSLSLPASFELDFWGRLSRATEAARARLLSAEENRRTVVQSLIAEAVSLYLKIESLERQIQVTHKHIQTFRQRIEIIESRYKRGLASVLDVRQARRLLAQARSRLPALNAELGIHHQSLSILQGLYPKNSPPHIQAPDYFQLPPQVPPGLPSELLHRRPDIRAAEADLHAACALIGVAKASRFPKITLTGNFGYASDELDSLFDPESELWSIAAGGVQSVFDAGKRAAAQRASIARYEQAQSAYAKTVLQAFADVEGALLNRKQLIERRNRLLTYLNESAAILDVASDRYNRGLVDYLTVLDAQQAKADAELQLITVEYEILSNHVRLCRALGGGWDLDLTKERHDASGKNT